MASSMRNLFAVAALLAALAVGYGAGREAPPQEASDGTGTSPEAGKILYYRNPMGLADTSPVPKQDSMGMDYIPVYENEARAESGTVQVGAVRVQRLGVRTEAAARRDMARTVHAVGTIQVDETRQTVVAPRFEGWIGKLTADATGQQVKKGDALFDFYSPQIVQIEAEYLSLAAGDSRSVGRLTTLAVPDGEIKRLQRERTINNAITYRAPIDGTIMEKQAVAGMRFASGDALYRLVDLSTVWAVVDIYEQDLERVSVGQAAQVTLNAYPDKIFEGKVAFVYPALNPATRTAKARIELPNPDGLLRTEMYAAVALTATGGGDALAVPASAVLDGGTRKTVLIDRGEGLFQSRPVKTGAESGGYVAILDGVSEGERVVTNASFLIDAESNMRAALQNLAPVEQKP